MHYLNQYLELIARLPEAHYFNYIEWPQKVLGSNFEVYADNGFGILMEYKTILDRKLGFAKGNILFDRNTKTEQDFLNFLANFKKWAQDKRYIFVGFDFVEPLNEFNRHIKSYNIRGHIAGSAFIYPRENWLSKFDSKHRYNLTYAGKKAVKTLHFSNKFEELEEFPLEQLQQLQNLIAQTIERHGNSYSILSKKGFEELFNRIPYLLNIAEFEGQWISYSLSLFSPDGKRLERVFAGNNNEGLKLRASAFLETKVVELCATHSISTYDLWGITRDEKSKFTNFKLSLADDKKYYRNYGVLKISPICADILIFFYKIKSIFHK